ncbi:hypothetical protein [Pectobacterium phage Jarilo]|uniref:Uncharacterized protein n=1 Tax=Pectobacterium phage Jarilo TaxID=2163634 RepID=A0A2S1GSY2_9CAUD|nr:hypothetical protein HOT17_gp13 [Pectobacterium phage Jarilo]AWD92494.1 hypothetical protein [Pectobacterium phage Jarilo]
MTLKGCTQWCANQWALAIERKDFDAAANYMELHGIWQRRLDDSLKAAKGGTTL